MSDWIGLAGLGYPWPPWLLDHLTVIKIAPTLASLQKVLSILEVISHTFFFSSLHSSDQCSVCLLHRCAFAAPAYSMSTPINYFYAAKHVIFGRTALLLFREKHTFELVCTQHMYVQPSDAIGVMVGLKISRLGGKIGQSSLLAPCLPACLSCLPYSQLTDPVAPIWFAAKLTLCKMQVCAF